MRLIQRRYPKPPHSGDMIPTTTTIALLFAMIDIILRRKILHIVVGMYVKAYRRFLRKDFGAVYMGVYNC